jgi:hypothetical protein
VVNEINVALLNYKIRMKLKPLQNTTEAETSICLFKTGGPSMLGTPGGKKKINRSEERRVGKE